MNIDHTLTICYQSNTINVHDNKDGIFEFSNLVLLADLNRGGTTFMAILSLVPGPCLSKSTLVLRLFAMEYVCVTFCF